MSAPDQVVTEESNVTSIVNTNSNTCPTTTTTSASSTSSVKPKSYYRLTRILRKPKSTVKPHPWRRATQSGPHEKNTISKTGEMPEEEEEEEYQQQKKEVQTIRVQEDEDKIGFSLSRMQELINSLTPSEKERARAGLAPLSQTQEALAQRAARFGLSFNTPISSNQKLSSEGDDTATNKMARVETTTEVVIPLDMSDETLQRREARFKTPEQMEMELQMQRRAERFGTINCTTTNNEINITTSTTMEVNNQVQSNAVPSTLSTKQSSEIKLSDADRAAMEARAKRFGM